MLPTGTTAELASYADQQCLKGLHPPAQTVARILVGRCSCDLVRRRLPDTRDDERHLRERYRALQLGRAQMIESLDRHRVHGRSAPGTPHDWAQALAGFVVEHARNAGPTLYLLHFGPGSPMPRAPSNRLDVAQVRQTPRGWITEESPTLVS